MTCLETPERVDGSTKCHPSFFEFVVAGITVLGIPPTLITCLLKPGKVSGWEGWVGSGL